MKTPPPPTPQMSFFFCQRIEFWDSEDDVIVGFFHPDTESSESEAESEHTELYYDADVSSDSVSGDRAMWEDWRVAYS